MTFKSAVDTWFYLVLVTVVVTMLISLRPLMTGPVPMSAGVLEIRSGPFKWTIPLDAIKKVDPSRSLLSSPALSLDRLRIQYGGGKSILVSPNDRDGFLAAIGQSLQSE